MQLALYFDAVSTCALMLSHKVLEASVAVMTTKPVIQAPKLAATLVAECFRNPAMTKNTFPKKRRGRASPTTR